MVFWASDDKMMDHFCPWPSEHIEIPDRMAVINQRMDDCDLFERVVHIQAREATLDEIKSVHTERFIEDLKSTVELTEDDAETWCTKYEDVYVNSDTYECALLAAGSSIDLVKAVYAGKTSGFASVRPPGHHASPDAACGFCFFNNVVIAAKQVLKAGASRVMIVDWDVHAGQGTQECIEKEENIRAVSIHRFEDGTFWPNLEQTAVCNDFKNTVNVPLNKTGMTDTDYLAIMNTVVLPMIADYQPSVIVVSCGFDAAFADPEGKMLVSPGCYGIMTKMLLNTGIPVALILEGGYFLESVSSSVEFVIRAMLHETSPHLDEATFHHEELSPVIRRVFNTFSSKYPSFGAMHTVLNCINPLREDEQMEMNEFRGKRYYFPPYPTRGLYKDRHPDVDQQFRDDLDDIVNAYKAAAYPIIKIDQDQEQIHMEEIEGGLCIYAPVNLFQLIHHLIILPLNPITVPYYPRGVEQPSDGEIAMLVKFIKDNEEAHFNKLPLFKL